VLLDKLYETILAGGWILLPIFAVGSWAFFLLLRTLEVLGADLLRKNMHTPLAWFRLSLRETTPRPRAGLLRPGVSYELMEHMLQIRDQNPAFIKESLGIYLQKLFQRMQQGLFFVGVLASVAPLLGLLGTVDGMVKTFITITRYGNSNPVLMADGISEALLTTQSGLLIAFPLLLSKNLIDDRVAYIKKQLERLGNSALAELEKHR
jgi:biopolymer transport protein ExbB